MKIIYFLFASCMTFTSFAQCNLTAVVSSNPSDCGDSTGTATVTLTNGTGPYNYNWSNGGNTPSINGLSEGIYTVNITDDLGCAGNFGCHVHNSSGFNTGTVIDQHNTCYGVNDGVATCSYINFGNPPYTYEWSNGESTVTATQLPIGLNTLIVKDASLCQFTNWVVIYPATPVASPTGDTEQFFCMANNPTVNDLEVTGTSIVWYDAASNGNVLVFSTALQDGEVYYAKQNDGTCESYFPLEVIVTIETESSFTETVSALDSYTWSVNNQTYTQSGQYTEIFQSVAGCDSTYTLDLSLDFTGIDELNSNTSVYPIPANNELNISTSEIGGKYVLFDLSGREVISGVLKNELTILDISTLIKGAYVLCVNNLNSIKVIKD